MSYPNMILVPFLRSISFSFVIFLQKLSIPWTAMLTSIPTWALLATQSAQNWGFWMLLTKIPSYMTSVLRFDITQVSIRLHIYVENIIYRMVIKS